MTVHSYISMAVLGMTITILALCMTETPAVADDGLTRTCRFHFKAWRKMAGHKAFAASQIKDGLQGCGWSYAWETRGKAVTSALSYCKSDAERFIRGEKPSCRLVQAD